MNFFEKRRIRKNAEDAIRHARHIRNLRDDILIPSDLEALKQDEIRVQDALKTGDWQAAEKAVANLCDCVYRVAPASPNATVRENLEVLVVAVAVAMAFRTYFIQPFKIPTGSMQPTLYGVHSHQEVQGVTDRILPLKMIKWLVTGKWYKIVRVEIPGQLSMPMDGGMDNPSEFFYYVGSQRFSVPKDAVKFPDASISGHKPGAYIQSGTVLWEGFVTAGDHVFVDKVRWNFTPPKRGSIMVFSTDGITSLPVGTHYIKRMAGTPGDTLSINSPYLVVNGEKLMTPDPIRKISLKAPPYDKFPYGRGYSPAEGGPYLSTPEHILKLKPAEYFALGDNTGNSRDSRYWGTVPQANLVGPAVIIYWPFSERWGISR